MTETTDKFIELTNVHSHLFDPETKNDFKLIAEDFSLPVTLVECTEKPEAAGPDTFRTPFTLIFQAPVDDEHPMQKAQEFYGTIEGHADGAIGGLIIYRMLRPAQMPEGAYYQVMFN